jgi:hypothetical protein
MNENGRRTGRAGKSREIPTTIDVGVYYYMDEDGKPVFDLEEMQREFETKLEKLQSEE